MRNKSRGFTLLEMMIAVGLTALLFFGAATLYVTTLRTVGRTHAQTVSSAAAANALARVTGDVREAYWVDLPTDAASDSPGAFAPPAGHTASDYITAGQSAAVQITFPAPADAPVKVQRADGLAQTLSTAPYKTAPGPVLLLYRADASGTPCPADGRFLWALGTERGGAVPVNPVATLCDAASTPPAGAVQFSRVRDSTGAALPGQVETKIVAVAWSLAGGPQGSESSTATLTGKCVFQRNRGN